jgi:dipeptidyl aminopeptidase/acylaminoacyl peptidase
MPTRTTKLAAIAGLAAALLVGCGEDRDAPEQPPQSSHATTASTPTPPAPPPARTVRFTAADGEAVTAEYTPAGRRAPAVVLLHEVRGPPTSGSR